MKIFIINPPAYQNKEYIREGRCMQTKSSWAALWMPLSLAYIASLLREKGHEIKLIDCIADKVNMQNLIASVKDFYPDIAIINTGFPSIKGDMETVRKIKEISYKIKTLVIGLYPTLFEKKCLEEFSQVDFGIVGETEWVVANLIKSLEKNESLENIKGLIFRKDSEVIVNEPQNLLENDPNELPLPARDLLNNEAYKLPTNNKKFTLVSIGRGCPFNCIYCTANVYYGKKFRKRTVASIIQEIEECINKYGIETFLFWGESFTIDPEYGEKICDEIINKNLKIVWSTTSRVDTLNEKLLFKMKKAGCTLLGLGIESANQHILDNMKKGTTVNQIKMAIQMVKKAGIRSMGHFIFGLPGETKESAGKTIDFALKSGVDFAQFYCSVPYPKTELGRIAREKNWVETDDWSQFDLTKSVMKNDDLTSKDVKKIRDRAYRKFYFRPKMVLTTLKEVDSLKSLLSTLNFIDWIKARRK